MNINPVTFGNEPQKGTGAQSALDKDAFLQLLTAQLQHQDPLNPATDVEFIQQLTSFATLEQMQQANENLGVMQLYEASINNSNALNLLGQKVKILSGEIDHQGGSHEFTFYPDPDAISTKIEVVNSNGETVYHTEFPGRLSDQQDFTWDGKNQDGESVANGNYHLRITHTYDDGETAQVPAYQWRKVDGLAYENGGIVLLLGNSRVPIEAVTEVKQTSGGAGLKTNPDPLYQPRPNFLSNIWR
ncbi:MAG: flagellar hook assembly protein FlgD [Acidobacteria bacterium]|nr:flagellar hook assembly protein FlgD [Acidobacteriota bacterium]